MKTINTHTKIAELIRENPDVIDAIASINPHFRKLKNPVLRKILAARVTIEDAARIGKCSVDEFFEKLKPLGFTINYNKVAQIHQAIVTDSVYKPYDIKLDVRENINKQQDPFRKIMKQLSELSEGTTLLLINSFEPTPLIRILEERSYTIEVMHVNEDEVHTYIVKNEDFNIETQAQTDLEAFHTVASKYEGKMQVIDVRLLPMPQPMTTILASLDSLAVGEALYVHHKKFPRFLLPELVRKEFSVVFKPAEDGVKLIIYKDENA